MSRAELNESASIMADEFGSAGTYTPVVGTPVTVAPVMTYGFQLIDDFGAYELRDRANIDMAEYPGEPEQGDSLVVGDDSYTVDTWEQVGSMWHITLRIGVAPAPPVDTTPPYITTIQVNGGLGIATSRTVSVDVLIAADDMSSVLDMTYLVNTVPGTPPSTMDPGWLSYANRLAPVTVPADGNYTFTGYAKDEAGNVSIGQEFAQQAVFIDSIAPEVVSGQVDVTGLVLTIGMSEAVTGNVGFSMTADGLDVALSNPTAPDASTIQFDVAQVFQGKVLLLSYAAGDVVDQVGNPLADFSGQSVTNNSDVPEVIIPVLSAFTYDQDTFEILDKEVGVGAVATSRVAVINVPDDQGAYKQLPSGQIAYHGARVVQNAVPLSEDFEAWSQHPAGATYTWNLPDPHGTNTAFRMTCDSSAASRVFRDLGAPALVAAGTKLGSSLYVRVVDAPHSGSYLQVYDAFTNVYTNNIITSNLPLGEWVRVKGNSGNATGSAYIPAIALYTGNDIVIEFAFFQTEVLSELVADWIPSEYVANPSTTLISKSFANNLGNTVNGYIVDEAVGGLLAQHPYAAVAPEATNYFLNSQAPVTQDVAGRTGVHTVSVIGAGTVTLSGGMAGVVSEGSPVTGDPGGVTVTCTVSGGPPANVQFEDNATATYPIYTTSVPVTRDKDAITVDSANLANAEGSLYFDLIPGGDTSALFGAFLEMDNGFACLDDGIHTNAAAALVDTNVTSQIGMVWSSAGMQINVNGTWSQLVPHDGDLLSGALGVLTDASTVGRIKDLKIWDAADKALIESLMPVAEDWATDFVMVARTTTANEVFTIPCGNIGVYNANIEWGDGGPDSTITAYNDLDLSHAFAEHGNHIIRISGSLPQIRFNNTGDKDKVTGVLNGGPVGTLAAANMLQGCANLVVSDLSGFDVSAVNSLQYLFRGCSSLASVDMSGFDTLNVTSMAFMFNVCPKITDVNLSAFNTPIVNSLTQMFNGCSRLVELDMSVLDVSEVTNMAYMFLSCSSLVSCNVSGIDTQKLTTTGSMFQQCSSLADVGGEVLGGADIINTTTNMFNSTPAVSQASIDDILAQMYANRNNYTWTTPVLNLSAPIAVPSGIYQDATPPTTGQEFRYKLENDPDGEGFNTWTITV